MDCALRNHPFTEYYIEIVSANGTAGYTQIHHTSNEEHHGRMEEAHAGLVGLHMAAGNLYIDLRMFEIEEASQGWRACVPRDHLSKMIHYRSIVAPSTGPTAILQPLTQ